MDAWHELRVSRTAKSGILQVDSQKAVEGFAEVFAGLTTRGQTNSFVRFLQLIAESKTHIECVL